MSTSTLGARLREARHSAGLTARELGEKANVSYHSVYTIESDKVSPTVATIAALASVLYVSLDWLVGVSDVMRVRDVKRAELVTNYEKRIAQIERLRERGHTVESIAERLGCTPKAIYYLLAQKCLKKLHESATTGGLRHG